ncbi:PRP38 family-domain-containing protein [Cladochytrium replicatum]|nr:PRP38 family-domain-containing protein [Cladochytrium replicatum]
MANRTVGDATAIHGTNPQYLIEKIIRTRIYECMYWKEHCFGLTMETFVTKAVQITSIGGQFGNQRPTEFLCLALKMLQLQPQREIVIEFIKDEDFKYLRALAAFYLRLTGSALDIYTYLEPLLYDKRKLRRRLPSGAFDLTFMDEFVDALLTSERVCDTIMPRVMKRELLVEKEDLQPRVSILEEGLEDGEDGRSESESSSESEKDDRRGGNVSDGERDSKRGVKPRRRSSSSENRERHRRMDNDKDRETYRDKDDRRYDGSRSERDHRRSRSPDDQKDRRRSQSPDDRRRDDRRDIRSQYRNDRSPDRRRHDDDRHRKRRDDSSERRRGNDRDSRPDDRERRERDDDRRRGRDDHNRDRNHHERHRDRSVGSDHRNHDGERTKKKTWSRSKVNSMFKKTAVPAVSDEDNGKRNSGAEKGVSSGGGGAGGAESLSIEETNKIRASLGLKPLRG